MPNIEEIIRKAMEEGAFKNLRGTGKPLSIEENPYIDPSWQLAYHLLKENGFALSFIEVRQTIDSEHAAARAGLARAWEWHQAAVASNEEPRWIEVEMAESACLVQRNRSSTEQAHCRLQRQHSAGPFSPSED